MSSRSQPPSPASDVSDRFLEIVDVMMIGIDATGEVTYTNAKARDILGYEPGTLVGADWFDTCIPDRIQEEVRGVFDRLMTGEIEADERHENVVVTADGQERIIEWHNTVLRDDEGSITGTLSSGQDVTDRKEREAKLERQELYLESVSDLVTVVELDGTIRYDSPGISEMLGYEPGERVGEPAFTHIHPEDRERVKERFQERVAEEGSPRPIEYRARTTDGEWIWVESRARVLTDDPLFEGIVITIRDITERKEGEAELERHELYLESVSDLTIVVDEDGLIKYESPSVTGMLGYEANERVGESAFDYVHPEDRDRIKERLRKYAAGESVSDSTEFRVRRKDGTWLWVESRARNLLDSQKVSGIIITLRDITERKEGEAELERHELYLESAADLVSVVDENGVFNYESPAVSEILGYDQNERIGDHGFDYIHPDDRDRIEERLQDSLASTGVQEPYEYRARTKDGDWIWIESLTRNLIENQQVNGIVVTARDITARKKQQREKEVLWRAIEKANSPLTLADPSQDDLPIVYVNEAFEQLTGYTEQDISGQNCRILQGKNTREEPVAKLREAIASEEPVTVELRNYRKDGTEFWNKLSVTPVYDEDGDPVRFLGTQDDITERKQQERKRKQVIDRVTDGIFELDTDWRFSFISDQGAELLNTPEAELLDRTIWDVFDDARGTTFEERYREVMDTREPISFVAYYSGLDSWFDIQAYPNDDGGIAVYFRDVTERKEREQARQRAEKQYQTLLETAPDPIVAADAETGEIIEVNEAAESLFAYPESELIGRPGSFLYPTESKTAYESFFTDAIDDGGTWRRLSDGSQIHVVTGEGTQIPVEVSVRTVKLGERDVTFGIIHNISDQLKHERRLRSLNEATRELLGAKTARDVEQTVVKTLGEVLDVATVAFYHFDEVDWELQPVITTDGNQSEEPPQELPVLEPGVGVEWHALSTGETTLVDDFWTRETEYEFERTVRSELVVPIADRGILVAGDTQPAVFTDQTVSLVETLGATAEAALSRVEREQQLQDQRRELQQVESINEQIRDISHAIVQSETRAELEQMVCECLVESELVDFAWIGRVDLGEKQLSPQARAGNAEGYLDSIPLGLDAGGGSEPSVQAARSREVSGSANIATDIQRDDWRSVALERGFQSVLSIPLVYEETLYGVLSVYARTQSGFPAALRSVLEDLGDLFAHSIIAMERKEVLHTDQTMELDFEIQDRTCLFCRLTAGTNLGLELDGFVPQPDQSTLVFARVTDGTPAQVLKEAEQLDGVEKNRLIERETDTFVQMYFTGPFLGSELSDRGLILRRLSADKTGGRMTVEVPRASDARQAVDLVMSQYEDAQLLAKRESSTSSDSSAAMPGSILETLTTRQREVIETAYRCGYFDSPRDASGKDIAEMFGFSNPTFHEHVREAERKLFDTLLKGDGKLVAATESADSD